MNEIKEYTEKMFEDIKQIDEFGNEYWSARELQKILEYKEWRKFAGVISKAKIACTNSDMSADDQFVGADKLVSIGSKSFRRIENYKLTRYACYLIAQNGDSRKKVIALAQTYFAIQTRRTRTTFSPLSTQATASSAVNTTLPQAAPGEAPSPFPSGVAALRAAASNCG